MLQTLHAVCQNKHIYALECRARVLRRRRGRDVEGIACSAFGVLQPSLFLLLLIPFLPSLNLSNRDAHVPFIPATYVFTTIHLKAHSEGIV